MSRLAIQASAFTILLMVFARSNADNFYCDDAYVQSSPRPDSKAEILAYQATGCLAASDEVYNRVTFDLASLTDKHAFLDEFLAKRRGGGRVTVTFDDEGIELVRSQTYMHWIELNSLVEVYPLLRHDKKYVTLYFRRILNTKVLAQRYSRLPNVIDARPEVCFMTGSGFAKRRSICLLIDGDVFHYLYSFYLGQHAFETYPGGVIVEVEALSDGKRPGWFNKCLKNTR